MSEENNLDHPVRISQYISEPLVQEVAQSQWLNDVAKDLLDFDLNNLSPEKERLAKQFLSRLSSGLHASIPITCPGDVDACPLKYMCLLDKLDKPLPTGKRCPIEAMVMVRQMSGYANAYKVTDNSSFIDRSYVQELAVLDVLINRCELYLARPDKADMIEMVTAGIDQETGQEYERPAVSEALNLFMKLTNKRDKIHSFMMGTPAQREKLRGKGADEDEATRKANARKTFIDPMVVEK